MKDAVIIVCEAGNTEWLSGDDVRITYEDTRKWEDLTGQFYGAL
jgi:hypothetical protein